MTRDFKKEMEQRRKEAEENPQMWPDDFLGHAHNQINKFLAIADRHTTAMESIADSLKTISVIERHKI